MIVVNISHRINDHRYVLITTLGIAVNHIINNCTDKPTIHKSIKYIKDLNVMEVVLIVDGSDLRLLVMA